MVRCSPHGTLETDAASFGAASGPVWVIGLFTFSFSFLLPPFFASPFHTLLSRSLSLGVRSDVAFGPAVWLGLSFGSPTASFWSRANRA